MQTPAVDVDTHEMIPFHFWAQEFGEPIATKLAGCEVNPFFADAGGNTSVRPDIAADDVAIAPDVVSSMKGCAAPGAIDMSRRPAVMQAMGVDRSLVFPSFGLVGFLMANSPEWAATFMGLGLSVEQTRQTGLEVIKASNDWAVRAFDGIADRARPVGLLLTESPGQMTRELATLIERGFAAVWIPSGHPPAGTSPADPALDAFWRTAAEADVPVLLHIGTDFTFPASLAWTANVPAFVPPNSSAEFVLSPFAGATAAAAAEHFLAAMVLGGVFERVPDLRFGVIELGAQWFGPLADRLDQWAAVFPKALRGVIGRKPSEYLARNVRVAPFHFEPVDEFIERHPGLVSSYCFSSDYPHVEGGRDAREVFEGRIARLGPDVVEKFFRTNGEWLLPARPMQGDPTP